MADLTKLPALLQAQDWTRAEALLREAARHKSASAEVFYNLAKVLEAAGKPEQRLVWLKRAVAARRDYVNAWYELGRVLLDDADLPGAAQAIDKALALAPNDADARRMAARLALRLGNWTKAAKMFGEAGDLEARLARYGLTCETGGNPRALRDALLADPDARPDVLRALTRTSKGAIPLTLPQLDRT